MTTAADRTPISRFVATLTVVFVGTLATGVLALLAASVSACFLSPVNRCFSFSRDAGIFLFAAKAWFLPALAAAVLTALTDRLGGGVAWWHVLLISVVVVASGALWPAHAIVPVYDPPLLVAVTLILFVGVQLSRLFSRLFGSFAI